MLDDTSSVAYLRLKSAGCDGKDGTVTVFGPADESFLMADRFMSSDEFDNVDGSGKPDGLPDFAGETIAVSSDLANAPYNGYLEYSNEEYLKEVAVKGFLDAIDTICAASQYDRENFTRKQGAKVIVLSSSYLSAYGYYDISKLMETSGSGVKVISPVHAMFDFAVSRHGEDAGFVVWTSPEILGAGIYSIVAPQLESHYPSMKYDILCPDMSDDCNENIISFLRACKDSGHAGKLDAVLVDDLGTDASELNLKLKEMLDNEDDSLMIYKPLLADGFEFVDAYTAVVSDCIGYLRSSNQFTHKVAYPDAVFYAKMPLPGLALADYDEDGMFIDSFKFNRAPASDFHTSVFVEMEKRCVPDSILNVLRQLAPNTYKIYVSK